MKTGKDRQSNWPGAESCGVQRGSRVSAPAHSEIVEGITLCLFLLAVQTAFQGWAQPPGEKVYRGEEALQLVGSIVAEQLESYHRIGVYTLHGHRNASMKDAQGTHTESWDWTEVCDVRTAETFAESVGWSEDAKGGVVDRQEKCRRMVMNKGYLALWDTDQMNAQVWEYGDIAHLPKKIRVEYLAHTSRVLVKGFGDGDSSFESCYDRVRSGGKWRFEVVERPDEYQVNVYFGGKTLPTREYFIAPNQGYLITRCITHDENALIMIDVAVEVQQVKEGFWFPKSWCMKQYDTEDAKQQPASPFLTDDMSISDLSFSDTPPDGMFKWTQLGIAANVSVNREDVRGVVQPFRVVGRELVPFQFVDELVRMRDLEAQVHASP